VTACAQSQSSSGLKSYFPSALAKTSLAIETPLEVDHVEYAELPALASAPERSERVGPHGMPDVPAPAPALEPAEGAGWRSLAVPRRRVCGLGGGACVD
jgi:hypothetical protein